jgi:hypothetical protein
MIELVGFAPDAEPSTPGVFTDCTNLLPFEQGFRAAPQPVALGLPALAAECRGAAVTIDLAGNSRLLAGTTAGLYEAAGTAWTDRSQAGGYTLGSEDRWSFAAYGNAALAATPSKRIQRSTGAGFTEVSGAPQAQIIESVQNFVIAFHTNEATYGDQPDRWWCCALYDETTWAPNVSTQATTGRIVDGRGGFKAAKRLGSDIVAYKERGVFVGRYSGAPVVWDFTPASEDVGCIGQDAIAVTSVGHVFVGSDNIYLFDGTRPVPLATDVVRQWWLDNSSSQYRQRTRLLWDRFNNLVWMFFPGRSSSGAADMCLVYHALHQRWGRCDTTAEAVLVYLTNGSMTYDGGSPLVPSFDGGPSIPFDSVLWLNAVEAPALFASNHQLKAMNGDPGDCSFTTGDYGDARDATMVRGLRLQFSRSVAVADCTGFTREVAGGALTAQAAVELDDGCFDVRQTARFHRFRVDLSGDARFSGIDLEIKPAGRR